MRPWSDGVWAQLLDKGGVVAMGSEFMYTILARRVTWGDGSCQSQAGEKVCVLCAVLVDKVRNQESSL